MMRAAFIRDATLMIRRRGLIAALLAHSVLASGFMLAWAGQGRVPVLRGDNLYEQLGVVQWAFMALLAPWIAARMMATERRDEWTRLSVLTGQPPASLIATRLAAVTLLMAAAIAAAWPAVLLAAEMSGTSLTRVAFDQLVLALCACCSAIVALHVELTIEDRVMSWIAATAASVVVFTSVAYAGAAAALIALSGATAAALWLTRRADLALWHLRTRRA